jgi:hypothetical protein
MMRRPWLVTIVAVSALAAGLMVTHSNSADAVSRRGRLVLDVPRTGGSWRLYAGGTVRSTAGVARPSRVKLPKGVRLVDAIATPSGEGFFAVTARGRVYRRGDAPALARVGAERTTGAVVAVATTRSGLGLYVVAANGTMSVYGDAPRLGELGPVTAPVTDIVLTPSGNGYWIVTSIGVLYSFGDAAPFADVGATPTAPVRAIAPTASGQGLWAVAADGGVFAVGDAPFMGSLSGATSGEEIVSLQATETGYVLFGAVSSVSYFGSDEAADATAEELRRRRRTTTTTTTTTTTAPATAATTKPTTAATDASTTATTKPTTTTTTTKPTTATTTVTTTPTTRPATVVGTDVWRANRNLVWNKRLPTATPTHPNSSAFRSRLVSFMRSPGPYYTEWSVHPNTSGFTGAVYFADANTPKRHVDFGGCWSGGGVRTIDAAMTAALNSDGGIRIPAGAQASPASDHEMVIYDRSNDTLYEFWETLAPYETITDSPIGPSTQTNPTANFQACTAGVMAGFSTTASGRFIDTPGYAAGLWGASASGLTTTGGRITVLDMQQGVTTGVIPHAIDIDIPMTGDNQSWPAWRHDAWCGDSDCPYEGLRVRLPKSFDTSTIANPFARMIARTAQDYGFIIADSSGAVSFRYDSSVSFTSQGQPDPWPALFAQYGINYADPDFYKSQSNVRAALTQIPWEQLEFLPHDYGVNGELG